jgi:hypothetical protein
VEEISTTEGTKLKAMEKIKNYMRNKKIVRTLPSSKQPRLQRGTKMVMYNKSRPHEEHKLSIQNKSRVQRRNKNLAHVKQIMITKGNKKIIHKIRGITDAKKIQVQVNA